MSKLKAAAAQVSVLMEEARADGKGFESVCERLGLNAKDLDAVVEQTVASLNGSATLEGALMNGLLIAFAAERPDGIDWSLIGQTTMHELRQEVLAFLAEHEHGSPKEIAEETGASLSTVSYHISELYEPTNPAHPSLIRLVKTEPRRGAVEHFYALRAKPKLAGKAKKGGKKR